MSEHEHLHDELEREADELERENDHLGEQVEAAKDANAALDEDALIATPAPHPSDDEELDPPPEAQYPAKD